MNIGGAGSYLYDSPVNEACAAVSMETNAQPGEEKKAPGRGPVKGEKNVEQKIETLSRVWEVLLSQRTGFSCYFAENGEVCDMS